MNSNSIFMQLLSGTLLGLVLSSAHAEQPERTILLKAKDATLRGWSEEKMSETNRYGIYRWELTNQIVSWPISVTERKTYRVILTCAVSPADAGSQFQVRFAGQIMNGVADSTAGWDKFRHLDLGPVMIRKPGEYQLEIQPVKFARGGLMNLKEVRLVPEL